MILCLTNVSRHNFTNFVLQATIENIYLVQKNLGHTCAWTTEGYSREIVKHRRQSLISDIII